MRTTVFLPGAGGRRSFWQPVCEELGPGKECVLLGWPGFGDEPADPDVRSLSDLTPYVLDRVEGDFNVVAQSMGGVVALQVALAAPERIRRLVLCATSGGVDFDPIPHDDWRPEYLRDMPASTPRWFVDDRTDVTQRLGEIAAPALLVWGAEDRIVPPAAGRLLAGLLPTARLVVIAEAAHDVAVTKAGEVAEYIRAFLAEGMDEDTLTPGLCLQGEGAWGQAGEGALSEAGKGAEGHTGKRTEGQTVEGARPSLSRKKTAGKTGFEQGR